MCEQNRGNRQNGGVISIVLEDDNSCPNSGNGCGASFIDCDFLRNRAANVSSDMIVKQQ